MCGFCEKIYPEKDLKDIVFARGHYKGTNIVEFITIDEEEDYHINVVTDDPYECGCMTYINFCPYCGRNLKEK